MENLSLFGGYKPSKMIDYYLNVLEWYSSRLKIQALHLALNASLLKTQLDEPKWLHGIGWSGSSTGFTVLCPSRVLESNPLSQERIDGPAGVTKHMKA